MAIRVHAPDTVRRIAARFTIERLAAGWTITDLCREVGAHPSNVHRLENGETRNPTLGFLSLLCEPLGIRLALVADRHAPLLELDENEIRALIEAAAGDGWRGGRWRETKSGQEAEGHLLSALRKLGKINHQGANENA